MKETYILVSEHESPFYPDPQSHQWAVHVFQEVVYKNERNMVEFRNVTLAQNIAIYTTAGDGVAIRNFEAHGTKVDPEDGM